MCSGEEWNGLRGPNKTLFSSLTCLGGMQPRSWTPIILGNLGNFLKSSKPHLWNEDNKSCPNWVMRDFEEIIHAQCMPDMSWIFRPQQICQQLLIEPRLRHLVPSSQGLLFWLFFSCVGLSFFGYLCYTVGAFSSCGKQGLVSSCCAWASHWGGFSCGAWAPGSLGLVALWHVGLAALWQVGSSQFRDQTYIPGIGRQIFNHWTTKEVPPCLSLHHFDWVWESEGNSTLVNAHKDNVQIFTKTGPTWCRE